jgi:hypothetical protein
LSIWKQRSPFPGRRAALSNANKFCDIQLAVAFRNNKLKDLRFPTGKGADVSVRDTKTSLLFTTLL